MMDYGALGLPFGSYFGFVFEAYKFPEMHTKELINEAWWKKFVRLLICVLLIVPTIIFGLIPGEFNVYLMMIIEGLIPSFLGSFIIWGLSDQVNKKLKLLQFESDEQKIFLGHGNE